MKLVHISDPHLGFSAYSKLDPTEGIKREADIYSAFEQAIDKAIELRPDVIVHALEGEQGVLGFYTTADQQWLLASVTAAGRRRMAEVATDHGRDWQQLGVSILHRLVIETLLGAKQLPKAEYVHLVEEAVDWLHRGDEPGKPFPLATLVMPATVEHVRKISKCHERMPAKSTDFYPKLLSGLVIHPLV